MKKVFLLLAVVCFITSCNVTESIIFNENMGGEYKSTFDMSPMMQIAGSKGGSNKPESEMKKMDTTIVFNDLFESHKDSIAALSPEQRLKLEKMRGMSVKIKMDEANEVFEFSMGKSFKSVTELATINDQMDEAMSTVKDLGKEDGQPAPTVSMDELTKTAEVNYAFVNNTFSRTQPVAEGDVEDETETDESTEEADEDDFGAQLEMQFEEIFSSSYYTLVYTFPRKVKSVSKDEATISEDGKTVFYEVPWNVINKDKAIMDLNVVLEH